MRTENYVPKLGELARGDDRRDAIHVAVAPVFAAERLAPGCHVGLDADGRATAFEKTIGVVDPFLNGHVEEGEIFWLMLLPNTITGLRHVWSHPSFRPKPPGGTDER